MTTRMTTHALKSWHLWPNYALNRTGVRRLIGFFALILGAGAIRSISVGVWPVALFLIADFAALCVAFYLMLRRARRSERIELTPARLVVIKLDGEKRLAETVLEPQHAAISLIEQAGRQHMWLNDKRRRIDIGSFLTEPELIKLKRDLDAALGQWRCRPLFQSLSRDDCRFL